MKPITVIYACLLMVFCVGTSSADLMGNVTFVNSTSNADPEVLVIIPKTLDRVMAIDKLMRQAVGGKNVYRVMTFYRESQTEFWSVKASAPQLGYLAMILNRVKAEVREPVLHLK